MRLDNVVYRLGFAPSRPAARQFVSHRHILVNGKKVNIPSYEVKPGDVVSLGPKAIGQIPDVKKLLLEKEFTLPGWLKRKAAAGEVVREPLFTDITEAISTQDIVEYYSR